MRETLKQKNEHNDLGGEKLMLTNAKGDQTPLRMEWVDVNDEEEEKFTMARSRKNGEKTYCDYS